jgi:hypothetical protein
MDRTHPRARALVISMTVGLAIIALYFIFIASSESTNGNRFGNGGGVSTLMATGLLSDTPAGTLSVEQTSTP